MFSVKNVLIALRSRAQGREAKLREKRIIQHSQIMVNINTEKISNALLKLIKVGVLFILFLPLVMNSRFFFPFIVPRNVAFRIIVEIIFAAFLILAYLNPDFRPKFNKVVWAVLAFFAIATIATFAGIGIQRSFWSNYERMSGLFHYYHLLMYFIVLISVFKNKKDWHSFITFSIFASVLMTILGLAQWLQVPFLLKSSGAKRLTGTVGNPTFFAAYLMFNLFFILYFWAREKRFNLKLFSLGFLVVDIFLALTSIFAKLFAAGNWGALEILKLPILIESFKYPGFFYPFLFLQVLILVVWFFRRKKNSIRILLSTLFIFEFYFFLHTQTRGAILGFWVAIVLFLASLFYLAGNFKKKMIYLASIIGLLATQLIMYQFGSNVSGAMIKLNFPLISSLGDTVNRISGMTALVGFAFSLVAILGISVYFLRKTKIKFVLIGILAILILAPTFIFVSKNQPWVVNNPKLNKLVDFSQIQAVTIQSRLLTWEASWKGWTESPKSFLIGYGPENYYYVFNKHFPIEIYKDQGSRVWFDRAHNIIFDIGVTTGILGLAAYLSILIFAVLLLIKNYQKNKVASSSFLLISLIVAYFIQNFFVFDTLNTEIPFYLFLAFVVYLSLSNTHKPEEEEESVPEPKEKDISYIYIAVVVLALFAGIFIVNARTLKANNYIFKSLITTERDLPGIEKSFEYFKKGIDEALPGRFEARQQLANYVNNVIKSKDFPADRAREMIDYTVEELKKSVEEEPLNVRQYLYLSTFYNATTKFNLSYPQKVIDLMQDGIELSPTRPHIYYEVGQAYAFLRDFEKSKDFFEKGAALASKVVEDQWNLLTIYIVFEQYDLADQQLQRLRDDLNWRFKARDYERLVELYGRVKNYSKMIEFQNKVVELEPSAESYAKLAALYAETGENQKAREATQKAVEVDSEFAPEAEKFLELMKKGEL